MGKWIYGLVLLAGLGISVLVGSNVYAQSNEELLKMITQMRQQIEAQQKQLQQMEQQLKRRVERPKEGVEFQPGVPATAPGEMPVRTNDWYVAGFVGGAFTLDTDVESTGNAAGLVNSSLLFPPSTKDVSLDASPLVGAKGGLCPRLFPNLCLELEFDYFQPEIGEQVVRGRQTVVTIGGGVGPEIREFASPPRLDLDVWTLGLNAVARIGFLPEVGYPLGRRVHLYQGVGPSFVWTRAKFKDRIAAEFFAGKKDTDFSVGVQALTGLKYFITKNLAVFWEYKFKYWDPDFKFSLTGDFTQSLPGAAIVTTNPTQNINLKGLNTNSFYVGLAFHP